MIYENVILPFKNPIPQNTQLYRIIPFAPGEGKRSDNRQAPAPSRAKMSKDNRGSSAHANGGAAKVKKALFFGGSTPFLWASIKEMGSKGRTSHRPPPNVSAHTHNPKEQIKGGTPGEGSPLDPLLRFNKHKRVPRSAERGQGRRPWTLPPLKRWTKLSFALRAAERVRRLRR